MGPPHPFPPRTKHADGISLNRLVLIGRDLASLQQCSVRAPRKFLYFFFSDSFSFPKGRMGPHTMRSHRMLVAAGGVAALALMCLVIYSGSGRGMRVALVGKVILFGEACFFGSVQLVSRPAIAACAVHYR